MPAMGIGYCQNIGNSTPTIGFHSSSQPLAKTVPQDVHSELDALFYKLYKAAHFSSLEQSEPISKSPPLSSIPPAAVLAQ